MIKKEKVRVKTRFVTTDKSQLTGQTLYDVIADKINYVIHMVRSEEPYYKWLSKYHLIKGSKMFYSTLPEDHPISIPLFGEWKNPGHMEGRMPSKAERVNIQRKYGYTLKWPPPGILSTIQTVFRDIEDKINTMEDIVLLPCRGYVDQNNRLIEPSCYSDENPTRNMISGYVIHRQDPEGIKIVNQFLTSPDTPLYEKYQMLRAKRTAPSIREAKIIASETMRDKAIERYNAYIHSIKALKTDVNEPDWNKIRGIGPSDIDDEE